VDTIQGQVGRLEEELKIKSSEYSSIVHQLNAENKMKGGNWLTKDLSEVVKAEHVVDTDFMESIFVAVPKSLLKEWSMKYEKLTENVVPRSSLLISEDTDYALYRVIVFRKFSEDWKNKARETKFIARDFSYAEKKSGSDDKKKLEQDRDKLRKGLIRWAKTNFSEAFIAWVHLKAIRAFVESVLRYGLPTNFQAVLLLSKPAKASKLRKALGELYNHLSSKNVFSSDKDEDPTNEIFYPYVYLEISLDYSREKAI